MLIKSLFLSAGVFATTALALGKVTVQNKCPHAIYYTSVDGSADAPTKAIQPNKVHTEEYRVNTKTHGGISIKVNKSPKLTDPIAQIEYTLTSPTMFYDLSFVNGDPFVKEGVTLTPSDKKCVKVDCPPGVAKCPGAYKFPTDDQATHQCADSANLDVVFCPGNGKGKRNDTTARLARHPHAKPEID